MKILNYNILVKIKYSTRPCNRATKHKLTHKRKSIICQKY